MSDLTERQTEVLGAIKTLLRERGIPPTTREIGKVLGIEDQPNAVSQHLEALEKKGFIRRYPGVSRGIVLTEKEAAR